LGEGWLKDWELWEGSFNSGNLFGRGLFPRKGLGNLGLIRNLFGAIPNFTLIGLRRGWNLWKEFVVGFLQGGSNLKIYQKGGPLY